MIYVRCRAKGFRLIFVVGLSVRMIYFVLYLTVSSIRGC